MEFCGILLRAVSQVVLQISISKMSLKKFILNPRANELKSEKKNQFSHEKYVLMMLWNTWSMSSNLKKAPPFYMRNVILTHKQLETHGCVPSTVVTDAPVLKHQTTSTHSAD